MKRLIFCVLLMTCAVSWADWEINDTDAERNLFFDRATIRKDGNFVKMWSMVSFEKIQTNAWNQQYSVTKMQFGYDCKKETRALLYFAQFSNSPGSGKLIRSIITEDNQIKWDPVIPGSLAEHEWNIACGKN